MTEAHHTELHLSPGVLARTLVLAAILVAVLALSPEPTHSNVPGPVTAPAIESLVVTSP
jgi:hypothetical protein